jgi:release factor glutamine methyltransferase
MIILTRRAGKSGVPKDVCVEGCQRRNDVTGETSPSPTQTADKVPETSPPADTWTVRRVLEWTTQHLKRHGSDTPRLDAEILLAHARGCPRIALYTQFDEPLSEPVRARMRDLVQRRAQSEPVAYLVGHREFFSLDFLVTRDVLIPRPDTETLVMAVLDAAKSHANARVLDLCTGSGCVAIAVAKNCPTAVVTATDISPAALAVAQENAVRHKVDHRVRLLEGDLFAAVPNDDRFDIMTANPPYVTTAELESLARDIRKYEPRSALDGGPDGLDVLRRIVAEAPQHLVPGGWLFVEISSTQADLVRQLLSDDGRYEEIGVKKDLSGRSRVAAARLKNKE